MGPKRKAATPAAWSDLVPGDHNVQIIRLWKSDLGPLKPEVALLLMAAPNYQFYRQDPLSWVNQYQIFGTAAVNRVIHSACHLPAGPRARRRRKASASQTWYLSIHHDPSCTAFSMAYIAATGAVELRPRER